MKVSLEIKKIKSILHALVLVFLIVISPCKVRNFIQAELGVPQTQVLNKSQSTIHQYDCQTLDIDESNQFITKQTTQQADALISEVYSFDFIAKLPVHFFTLCALKNQQVSDVPLYILYQNFQIYS